MINLTPDIADVLSPFLTQQDTFSLKRTSSDIFQALNPDYPLQAFHHYHSRKLKDRVQRIKESYEVGFLRGTFATVDYVNASNCSLATAVTFFGVSLLIGMPFTYSLAALVGTFTLTFFASQSNPKSYPAVRNVEAAIFQENGENRNIGFEADQRSSPVSRHQDDPHPEALIYPSKKQSLNRVQLERVSISSTCGFMQDPLVCKMRPYLVGLSYGAYAFFREIAK